MDTIIAIDALILNSEPLTTSPKSEILLLTVTGNLGIEKLRDGSN